MSNIKLLTLLSFALAGTAGCAVSTDGAGTVAQTDEALTGCGNAGTRFYVPPVDDGAKDQIKDLLKHRKLKDAAL